MLEAARGQISRRALRWSPLRALGEWALKTLLPERERMHLAADVLRMGQRGPLAALMKSPAARSMLPAFAVQGYDMTPPLLSRAERALERVVAVLPPSARMESHPHGLVFRPADRPRARVAFFTSCVMEVMFPRVNHEVVRLLVLAGCEVVVPEDQTCCGALQAHAGLRRSAKALARHNVRVFAADACDFIVSDSAGCGAALRESGHLLHDDEAAAEANEFARRVRDVSEVLDQVGLPEPTARLASTADHARPLRVGYHDPCHLAHGQGVRNPPRALLGRIPGVELVDLPNADWCCGSAGVYNLTHAEMANTQLAGKLDAIAQSGAEVVVASNPGCLLHMARGARARGMSARIVHLVEVLGAAYPAGTASAPSTARAAPAHAAAAPPRPAS
jgi:Fe-S oxidoreductase